MTIRLKDIIKTIGPELGYSGEFILSFTNLDDVFMLLAKKGIKEVSVSTEEMIMITMFMVSNVGSNEPNWDAFRALQEGKVNKFLGVGLKLEKQNG